MLQATQTGILDAIHGNPEYGRDLLDYIALWTPRLAFPAIPAPATDHAPTKRDIYMMENNHRIEFHEECDGGISGAAAAYRSLAMCMDPDPARRAAARKRIREPFAP